MSDQGPEGSYKKTGTLARVCFWVLAVCVVVAAGGWLYARQPHFSGKEAVTITVFATNNAGVLVNSTVTNREMCATVFATLRKARWGIDHKCAAVGTITVQYSNGKRDELGFLPSHGNDEFEFRHGWLKYNLTREKMYEALKVAGVDTEKIPMAPSE